MGNKQKKARRFWALEKLLGKIQHHHGLDCGAERCTSEFVEDVRRFLVEFTKEKDA